MKSNEKNLLRQRKFAIRRFHSTPSRLCQNFLTRGFVEPYKDIVPRPISALTSTGPLRTRLPNERTSLTSVSWLGNLNEPRLTTPRCGTGHHVFVSQCRGYFSQGGIFCQWNRYIYCNTFMFFSFHRLKRDPGQRGTLELDLQRWSFKIKARGWGRIC